MKLENRIVNLELSKQLEDVGISQNSLFYWVNVFENLDGKEECWQIHHISWFDKQKETYHPISALTSDEIIDTFDFLNIEKRNNEYHVSDGDSGFVEDTLCESLAHLYIWANTSEIEQGKVEP